MLRTFAILTAIAATAPARAGGLVVTSGSPRSIGRAGAGTVGDDGGGALLVNPAAIARRDTWRGQLGIAFVDDEIAWHGRGDAPVARNQAPSSTIPIGAVLGGVGSWMIGIGAMTSASSERALRRPDAIPPSGYGRAFDYRYAGLRALVRRDTVVAGVARRIGDQLAVGFSVAASRVAFAETRRVWAGFAGRDVVGEPTHDVELDLTGGDPFVPSATLGVLIAPLDEPIELGASVAWSQAASIEADVVAAGTTGGPSVTTTDDASGRLTLAHPWVARAGARYLHDHFVVELGGELAVAPRRAARPMWQLAGVMVRDPSSVTVDMAELSSRASQRRQHGTVRGAVDVQLIAGFLWASAGYAFSIASVERGRQSPTFGELGGHTLGLGLEGTKDGFTFTLGWSRTWANAWRGASDLRLDNPFRAGDAPLMTGTYDGAIDQLGVLVDAEL